MTGNELVRSCQKVGEFSGAIHESPLKKFHYYAVISVPMPA